MKHSFLPFAVPDIGKDEVAEVVDSLMSGWVTTGPKTKKFELEFAEYLGGGLHAVAVNSATAGLHLALESLGVGAGDEVITTTHTFTATAEVARYLGAELVLVDIDPLTYCIDPDAVQAAVTARTRAIVPVHFGGLSCDMGRLVEIGALNGIRLVEDAAHALPTSFRGRMVGTLDSDCTVFSFYATKTITTGEGGMIVTRNAEIASRARIMRLHGIDRDAFDRYTSTRPSWYYEVVAPGFKYNMTDIAAALGIQQLKRANEFHARRSALAERYFVELVDLPLILPPKAPHGSIHSWHLYVVQLERGAVADRDRVMHELYEAGIGCSVHYVPLHLQPYWRDRYRLTPSQFPASQQLYERSISLPLYTRMSDDDQSRVIAALRAILRKK